MSEFFPVDDDEAFWADPGVEPPVDSAEETPTEEVVVEEAPVESSEGTEADTAEEAQTERPRDEQGRFIKQQEAEEASPEQVEKLLAGKYKSPEELEQAYAELQARFGSQGSELGELRRSFEERFAGLEQTLNRPQVPGSWDELIEDNPAQAVQLAHQHGDDFQLRRAAQAWEEVAPGSVALWVKNLQLEEKLAQIDQRTQPVVQQTEDQARARAYLNVKSRFPDIEQEIDAMRSVAVNYPIAVKAIESGTPEEAEQGWEALYSLARAGRADTLRETAQQVARNAQEGEQRVREEAVVASASSVKTEAPKKSAADLIAEEWEALEKPLSDGWNIG